MRKLSINGVDSSSRYVIVCSEFDMTTTLREREPVPIDNDACNHRPIRGLKVCKCTAVVVSY